MAPLVPPPRSTSSPAPAPPPAAPRPSSPSLSRPSSPSSLLSSSLLGRPTSSKKGDTLVLGALMSDLSALSSSFSTPALLVSATFRPAPPPADAYAPAPPSDDGLTLAHLRAAEITPSQRDHLGRDEAVRLADAWVEATGNVLARARREESARGEEGTVRRAERVEEKVGRIEKGLGPAA
ncbi:hypothetical protein JCM10207_006252 [Rhodosporidiobolus poonsookiae]